MPRSQEETQTAQHAITDFAAMEPIRNDSGEPVISVFFDADGAQREPSEDRQISQALGCPAVKMVIGVVRAVAPESPLHFIRHDQQQLAPGCKDAVNFAKRLQGV